jgi:signal transduction histidine kinase
MWSTGQEFAASATHHERLRLSRELHDGLAQQLAMLQLRLGRVFEDTAASDPRSHDLEVAQRVLDSAVIEARSAIGALRSDRIPWQHFERALVAFCVEFSVRHNLDARVRTESSHLDNVDNHLQLDVLRILQEAFSNATRHGHAKRIHAVVAPEGSALRVTITDDGHGFDTALARDGLGLRSMAERVARRNGTLTVDSTPGQGTQIQTFLPLRTPRGGSV